MATVQMLLAALFA